MNSRVLCVDDDARILAIVKNLDKYPIDPNTHLHVQTEYGIGGIGCRQHSWHGPPVKIGSLFLGECSIAAVQLAKDSILERNLGVRAAFLLGRRKAVLP